MKKFQKHKKLILFDGICNLCNSSVQFIIKHDKDNVFLFAPLQSEVAKELIKVSKIDTTKIDSIVLYEQNKEVSYKSTAALKIAKSLRFPMRLMTVFFILPPFIRNGIYDYIAKNRYKWYGKRDSCMVPSPENNAKFVK